MNLYTYGGAGSYGEEICTEEVWRGYAECGFNVMFLSGKNGYHGEGWEGSQSKKCFDIAQKVGIEKVILDDHRIIELNVPGDTLIGDRDECRFRTEEELDIYVKKCMEEYAHEPRLYGLRLRDEPNMSQLKSYGQLYRSVKRVSKELGFDDFYVIMNLLPLVGDFPVITVTDGVERTVTEEYEYYLDSFMRETGADRLCVDNYPFRPRYSGGIFLLGYYTCFQIVRRVCDRHGAEMEFVLQSFEMIHKTKPEATAGYRRITTANEMMLQVNSALGFGIHDIAFYTYTTMRAGEASAYRSDDGSAFITAKGEKTRIYEFGKAAIRHARKLEETLSRYQFKGAKLFLHEGCSEECFGLYLGSGEFATRGGTRKGVDFDNSYTLQAAKRVSNDRDIMLVTELEKDGEQSYLMMVQNVLDIVYKTDLVPMKVTIDLGDHNCIKVFKYGFWEEEHLINGIYEVQLAVGEAVYIIPFTE